MIYLDYQATTPLDPTVRDAMLPWLGGKTGNPHAANRAGREAAAAIDLARNHIAQALEAASGQVIFTSGATEAANMAIRGAVDLLAPAGRSSPSRPSTMPCSKPRAGWNARAANCAYSRSMAMV